MDSREALLFVMLFGVDGEVKKPARYVIAPFDDIYMTHSSIYKLESMLQ